MKACVTAWQDIFNDKGLITDEFGLKALDGIKHGPLRIIDELTIDVAEEMAIEFEKLYPNFRYDHLEIRTDEPENHNEEEESNTMKFYKIDDQIVFSDKELSVGTELIANTTDGAHEKHVPVISFPSADTVEIKVGSVEHPSLPAHYIEWICLETSTGIYTKWLKPGDKPAATFKLTEGESAVSALEYCNLHGLWKATV